MLLKAGQDIEREEFVGQYRFESTGNVAGPRGVSFASPKDARRQGIVLPQGPVVSPSSREWRTVTFAGWSGVLPAVRQLTDGSDGGFDRRRDVKAWGGIESAPQNDDEFPWGVRYRTYCRSGIKPRLSLRGFPLAPKSFGGAGLCLGRFLFPIFGRRGRFQRAQQACRNRRHLLDCG
jgi:hypothetical protein